jgi:hypothetical protein
MKIYLNVIAMQTLIRNGVRNSEIIIKLNRRIRAYLILKYANIRKRLICAIRNINRIRLTRLSKNLFSFLIFTSATRISSFSIILTARFLLSIPFKHCMYLLRRGRRFIRKRGDITGMIYRSGIFMRIAA